MSKGLAVGGRRYLVAGTLVVALLGSGAVAVAAGTDVTTPEAVKPAAVHPMPREVLKRETLTPTQKKAEKARFIVSVPIVSKTTVLNPGAWVGDPANGGVKAKVIKLSNSGNNLRYRVVVPLAKSAVIKRGLTFTYRVKFSDGSSQWRTRGVTIS